MKDLLCISHRLCVVVSGSFCSELRIAGEEIVSNMLFPEVM